jgi:uncharacterized damage-inducible protein DinB
MTELAHLHAYNCWADQSLLAALRSMHAQELEEQRSGMYNTILGVLAHVAQVEAVYGALILGEDRPRVTPTSLDVVATALIAAGARLVELADTDLSRRFHIPWFERDVEVGQGLRQALTHSIHHRADINQWLPLFGHESADLDYMDWLLS